ncbi:MAG: hypothetical protein ACI9H8_000956 [Lysobacterales bacterium]|jgi:hypothetical protein
MDRSFTNGLVKALLGFTLLCVTPAISAGTDQSAVTHIDYSRSPETMLVSFGEIWPEFTDQDLTPLVRIYGDGRVVVHLASYMKQAGKYEMLLSANELEDLLLQLTPILASFDTEDIKRQKRELDDQVWDSAADWEDQVLHHVADAEYSVFYLNIDTYQSSGPEGLSLSNQVLERSWRGLRFDVRDYPELEPIQALMQAEHTLRAFTKHAELVQVESLP